jgi:hypothetical protein
MILATGTGMIHTSKPISQYIQTEITDFVFSTLVLWVILVLIGMCSIDIVSESPQEVVIEAILKGELDVEIGDEATSKLLESRRRGR